MVTRKENSEKYVHIYNIKKLLAILSLVDKIVLVTSLPT